MSVEDLVACVDKDKCRDWLIQRIGPEVKRVQETQCISPVELIYCFCAALSATTATKLTSAELADVIALLAEMFAFGQHADAELTAQETIDKAKQ